MGLVSFPGVAGRVWPWRTGRQRAPGARRGQLSELRLWSARAIPARCMRGDRGEKFRSRRAGGGAGGSIRFQHREGKARKHEVAERAERAMGSCVPMILHEARLHATSRGWHGTHPAGQATNPLRPRASSPCLLCVGIGGGRQLRTGGRTPTRPAAGHTPGAGVRPLLGASAAGVSPTVPRAARSEAGGLRLIPPSVGIGSGWPLGAGARPRPATGAARRAPFGRAPRGFSLAPDRRSACAAPGRG